MAINYDVLIDQIIFTVLDILLWRILMNARFAYLLVALFIIHGCASYQVTSAPPLEYDLEAQNKKAEKDGVLLLAKPIHQITELQKYFDDDPLKYGILPIQIHIENREHEPALICASEGINLMDPADARIPALTVEQVMDKVKKSHWRTAGWTVGFGVFGLVPSIINVNNTNKKMRADYETKLFVGGKIGKGSATEGFMFFSIPEDTHSLDGWTLAAVLKGTDKSEDLILKQALSGKIAIRKKEGQSQSSQTIDK
jgi:hypothetical protein